MAVRHYTLKVVVYEEDITDEAEPISERELSELASTFTRKQMEAVANLLNYKGRMLTGKTVWFSNFKLLQSWVESNKDSGARQSLISALSEAAKENIIYYDQIPSTLQDVASIPELTAANVLSLSNLINSESELRSLAIDELKVEDYVVEKHLSKQNVHISKAAYHVLREWRRSYENQKKAYVDLCSALKRSKMGHYKTLMLK